MVLDTTSRRLSTRGQFDECRRGHGISRSIWIAGRASRNGRDEALRLQEPRAIATDLLRRFVRSAVRGQGGRHSSRRSDVMPALWTMPGQQLVIL